MSRRIRAQSRVVSRSLIAVMIATFVLPITTVWAGHGAFRNSAVGGVSIDPTGVVAEPNLKTGKELAERMRKRTEPAGPQMNQPVELRMVSLRGLEEALRQAQENGVKSLPEDITFLAGITRIQYVFLYPEQNDIVLVGPGEGWRVDDKTNVVGITTGRPVIQLDDLLVAFRSVKNAGQGRGISCSIDPTEEGRRDFQSYINKVGRIERFNKDDAALAMGPQKITLTGVPTDSHFARVMVAADFRMKRYAMHLEKSPVAEMPSFLDLLKERRGKVTNAMPRWWLACNYDGVVRSEDGLAWELQGPGVKVMTEDDFIAADGNAKGTGKSHPVAQEWADMFTSKYDELTVKDPVFGELRNIMDLCVVAALIEKYGMLNKAGLQIPLIKGEVTGLDHEGVWNEPKWVATQCSTMKVGRDWVITASGGVQIDSWSIAEKTITKPEVAEVHTKARASDTKQWWWN